MSSRSKSLTVVAVSSNALAMTNHVFCSSNDFQSIKTNAEISYVKLPDGFIWPILDDESVNDGELALNKLQRSVSSIAGVNQVLAVSAWKVPADLSPVQLTHFLADVDLLSKNSATFGGPEFSAFFQEKFTKFVFRSKQVYFVNFQGSALKITVKGVNVAGYPQSSYGFITADTAIRFQIGDSSLKSLTINGLLPLTSRSSPPSSPVVKTLTISSAPPSGMFLIPVPDDDLIAKAGQMEALVKEMVALVKKPDAVAASRKAAIEGELSILRLSLAQEETKRKKEMDDESNAIRQQALKEAQDIKEAAIKEADKIKEAAKLEAKKILKEAEESIKRLKEKKPDDDEDGMALM